MQSLKVIGPQRNEIRRGGGGGGRLIWIRIARIDLER